MGGGQCGGGGRGGGGGVGQGEILPLLLLHFFF